MAADTLSQNVIIVDGCATPSRAAPVAGDGARAIVARLPAVS